MKIDLDTPYHAPLPALPPWWPGARVERGVSIARDVGPCYRHTSGLLAQADDGALNPPSGSTMTPIYSRRAPTARSAG